MSDGQDSSIQAIVFQLSNEWFVLPVQQIRGIERWRTITPVPDTPPAIVGLINQRGVLVTVIDARMILGLKVQQPDRNTRLILVHVDQTECAIIADCVRDILMLDPATIEPAPSRIASLSLGIVPTPFGIATLLDLNLLLQTLVTV